MPVTCWNFPEPTGIMRRLWLEERSVFLPPKYTACPEVPCGWDPSACVFSAAGMGAQHTLLVPHQGDAGNVNYRSCASRWTCSREFWWQLNGLLEPGWPLSGANLCDASPTGCCWVLFLGYPPAASELSCPVFPRVSQSCSWGLGVWCRKDRAALGAGGNSVGMASWCKSHLFSQVCSSFLPPSSQSAWRTALPSTCVYLCAPRAKPVTTEQMSGAGVVAWLLCVQRQRGWCGNCSFTGTMRPRAHPLYLPWASGWGLAGTPDLFTPDCWEVLHTSPWKAFPALVNSGVWDTSVNVEAVFLTQNFILSLF